jgi:small subunit ribosomal protein S16
MVVIRMRQPGKVAKGHTHNRIVVDEKASKKDGTYLDCIGYYDAAKKPMLLKMDLVKYEEWIAKGAQPTNTVRTLANKMKKYPDGKIPEKKKPVKKAAKAA